MLQEEGLSLAMEERTSCCIPRDSISLTGTLPIFISFNQYLQTNLSLGINLDSHSDLLNHISL